LDACNNAIAAALLDLKRSYHQWRVAKKDQIKLTFTWRGKRYMFIKVPFRLKHMAAHMQRQMEQLIGPTGKTPFQDDIAIITKAGGDHIQDVLKILELLTHKAGLRLQFEKCKFFQKELKVLGHVITATGIKMDPVKIKAITSWPTPIDGKALQRFLGAANFHRDFSQEYARIAAPLDTVRNIQGPIEWNETLLAAFNGIKDLFARNLSLRSINWDSMIYLTTDACAVGLGAWLGQKDEFDNIVPVICVSKKLNQSQIRWPTTKRELYALMWAMQKFRHYLLGKKFIARVDHRPLVAMLRNKLNIMMEGWVDIILQFDFIPNIYLAIKIHWQTHSLVHMTLPLTLEL
jgi:hypothetical protein